MKTVIISKEQAKFARYLANKAFGKKGTAKNVDGKKERTYITAGCCLIWTEATVAEGIEAQVVKAVWRDMPHSEGMLAYDRYHMDFMSAVAILSDGEEPKLQQDVVTPAAQEVEPPAEVIPEELESPKPEPEAKAQPTEEAEPEHLLGPMTHKGFLEDTLDFFEHVKLVERSEATPKAQPAEAKPLSVREKLDRCAAMRLAHDFGYPLDTPFKEIVEKEGTPAVLRYQEILQKVPLHGLTEARLKFAFPVEYASL